MNQFNYLNNNFSITDRSLIDLVANECLQLKHQSIDKCAQIFDIWVENNTFLYIKMELCTENLNNFLEEKTRIFDRKMTEVMNSIEFYISCQLFRELLESVKYLHELNPPIIHRNLKPHNILITKSSKEGHFFKLTDVGFASLYASIETSTIYSNDSLKYIAPEVINKESITTKTNIFSLGKIAFELFNLKINRFENQNDIS